MLPLLGRRVSRWSRRARSPRDNQDAFGPFTFAGSKVAQTRPPRVSNLIAHEVVGTLRPRESQSPWRRLEGDELWAWSLRRTGRPHTAGHAGVLRQAIEVQLAAMRRPLVGLSALANVGLSMRVSWGPRDATLLERWRWRDRLESDSGHLGGGWLRWQGSTVRDHPPVEHEVGMAVRITGCRLQ